MTKRWIGLSLAAVALAVSASSGFACDQQAEAADAKDAKDVKTVAAKGDAKGCDVPCCAHANAPASDKNAANLAGEKPCAAHDAKGCPKKAGATAANDTPKAEPAADPGTHR